MINTLLILNLIFTGFTWFTMVCYILMKDEDKEGGEENDV